MTDRGLPVKPFCCIAQSFFSTAPLALAYKKKMINMRLFSAII
jgi:hypothetical protein